MKLINNSHRVQHVETLNGAIMVNPGDFVEVERDKIMKSEFSRIGKSFDLNESDFIPANKIKKSKKKKYEPESFVASEDPIIDKEVT